MTYVYANDSLVDVLNRLLARLVETGIGLQRLYLDRGFYQVDCIRFLKSRNIPTVIPVIMRGKEGGPKRLLKTRKSYKTTYTMKSPRHGQETFDVFIVCKYSKGKYNHSGMEHGFSMLSLEILTFLFIRFTKDIDPASGLNQAIG